MNHRKPNLGISKILARQKYAKVVLDGRNISVMHGVEQALGRPARDFSDYVRDAAATGVWEARQ